jgi:hypothetical protein
MVMSKHCMTVMHRKLLNVRIAWSVMHAVSKIGLQPAMHVKISISSNFKHAPGMAASSMYAKIDGC